MAKPPMNNNSKKKGLSPDKKMKKKQSILSAEKVDWVDYKDVNLLRRFMSERAKIRARPLRSCRFRSHWSKSSVDCS